MSQHARRRIALYQSTIVLQYCLRRTSACWDHRCSTTPTASRVSFHKDRHSSDRNTVAQSTELHWNASKGGLGGGRVGGDRKGRQRNGGMKG
eukprot:865276-Rhodomonas_salina.1